MPCFDIVVPHHLKVAFHSKYYVQKLLLPQCSLKLDLEATSPCLIGERDCCPGVEVGEIQVQQYQQIWNKTAIFKEKEWSIQY
jgi:excinuclease UvrABC nuclease subunit